MQILLLNQFFRSDAAATGQLLSDLADHLVENGESVEVICGGAHQGGIASTESRVNVIRLTNSTFSHKFAGRMGSYISFLGGAVWASLRTAAPDVVVTLTTPPLLSLIGMMIQRLRGARHVIWEMDLYPDVAVDLGVLRQNGILARAFGWLADLPRRRADTIIVLGECMRARLLQHNVPKEKIIVAENWADRAEGSALIPFPDGPLCLVYSGNFGLAHDVETISHTLSDCRHENIRFVFAGGGSRYAWLQEFCRKNGLQNGQFLPYCDRQDLGARLASGHIGMVTQRDACLGSAVPSKTYGIMAAARPVLFIGPKESTPARIIARHGCGWQIDCGDSAGLVALLRNLNQQQELIAEAGRRSHRAFLQNYQRSAGVSRIAEVLARVAGTESANTPRPAAA